MMNDIEISEYLKSVGVPFELHDDAAIFYLLHTPLSLYEPVNFRTFVELVIAKNRDSLGMMVDSDEQTAGSDERRTARLNMQSEDATTQLEESCVAETIHIFCIPWVEVVVVDHRLFDLVKV